MRKASQQPPVLTNSQSAPVMHYFTAASFFATVDNGQIQAKSGLLAGAMMTPKRPPKLMDQRITIPKNARRNSQQKQELMSAGQPTMTTPKPLRIVTPQPIKAPQQQPRNQSQPMAAMTTMGVRGKGTMTAANIVKEPTLMETSATIFATPPRRNATSTTTTPYLQQRQQPQSIHRVHSASIVIPSRRTLSATFMRYTPPAMEGRGQEVAPFYAGSKFTESPSAKSLPLPPSHWLEPNRQLAKQEIVEETAQTMLEHSTILSTAEANNENFIPGTWSPPAATTAPTIINGNKQPLGIRMHPLHLISAAVMTS